MQGSFLLNVVVGESATILNLLTSKDQPLLIWWNTFLVLNFLFDVFNSIRWFDIKCDGFASECFDEDLHSVERQECTGKEGKKDLNYLHEDSSLTDVRKPNNLEVGKADRDRGMDESHSSF